MTPNRNLGVTLTADPTGLQTGLNAAASASQQFGTKTAEAFGRASSASAGYAASIQKVPASSQKFASATRANQSAAESFIRSLERQTAAIGKTRSELAAMQAAELGVSARAAPLVARLRETEGALGAGAKQFDKYGNTVKQTEAALRGVPAQLTDIFVSLQGGQRPVTVMLQQGGQLKDMFGGIVPAVRALATTALKMITPVTVAAGAVVGLYAAYRMGAAEAEEFNKTVVMTGNAAGVGVGQLMAMAASMDNLADVTQRRAAAALNQFAGSGKVGADNLERFSAASIVWEQATGQAVEDTAKKFAELGKAPVEASLKLNESMNYLTTSTYQQIKALEDAGLQTEAATLAQQLFADTLDERAPQILENIGLIEKGWRGVKSAIAEAVDAAAGIGRPTTPQTKLADLQAEYDQISGSPLHADRAALIQAQIVGLRDLIKWQDAALQNSAAQARKVQEYAAADKEWTKIVEGNLSKRQRMERDIADIRKNGVALGKTEVEIEKQIAAYRERNAGKSNSSQNESARLRAALEAERQREQALHATGSTLASLNQYEKQALVYAEKLKIATDAKTTAQLKANMAMAEEAGARKRANDEFERQVKESESTIATVQKQTSTLEDQIATFGMGKSAIEAMTIARLEERLVVDASLGASERTLEMLRKEIEERKKLLGAMHTKEGLEAQLKEWKAWEREIDRIFEQVGQSLTDQIFEGGKNARDLLKDMFKALTLRVVIQPMLSSLQGAVTNQLGGMLGYSNPGQGGGMLGMASNASSLHSAFSGGLTGNVSNSIGWLGEKLGSTALQNFAAGMVGGLPTAIGSGLAASLGTTIGTSAASAMATTTFSASLGGAAASGAAASGAAAGAGAASGAAGMGAAFGAALPWIGGALAIGSLLAGSFGGESRSGGSYNWTAQRGAVERGKWDDGDPGAEANQAISTILDGAVNAINSAFKGVGSEAGLSYFMGWAESSGKGRGGTASGGRLAIGGQELAFGTTRKGQGYGSTSGDLSEMIQNMTVDVYQTVIQAWQTGIDEFPQIIQDMIRGINADSLSAEAAQAIITQVQQTIEQVNALSAAFNDLPFEKLKNLSFDTTAALLQLSGGVESFVAAHEAYYQAVYSEQERLDKQRQDVQRSLGGLNMAMPETQAQYRALVESLNLNTQAGREAYTTLVALAPAWATVNEQMARSAQEASAAALAQSALRDGTIDVQSLARQLADASEATFVQAMVSVFDNLAGRLSSIVDGIANERSAVQAAIRQINDLGAMTPEQILAQVAGINTAMPGAGGLIGAQQALQRAAAAQSSAGSALTSEQYRASLGQNSANNAAALVAQRQREMQSAAAYLADRQSVANRPLTQYEQYRQKVLGGIFGDALFPDDIKQARQDLPGAQAGVERAAQLLQAAQAAAQAASAQASAANSFLENVQKAKKAADAQYANASKAAQKAQLDYADAMQNFAIDAGKSVSKLSSLREETLRYYEAQAALANLMQNSAEGLRKTVLDYRVSQLNPDDQFTYLQSEFEKAYSMALSTDGEVLAGYADKLSGMLNPLIEQANNVFGSQASLDSFIATALARAQNIAERVEGLTPTDYAADSLDVLNQIDATLAALEASARSAEQIMVDAINAGRDATVNGLRQVVNALTGSSVAAFAAGGYHTGGLRLVGERGPELEVTGPSRIYSAQQTRSILSGGGVDSSELVAEVKALRNEVSMLRIEARATATNTHKIAKQGDRNEVEGVLVRTDAGEPLQVEVVA